MADTTEETERIKFPPVKFCPSCGSQNLEPPFDGHLEDRKKTGTWFGECSECGTHFRVSGYHEFVIPDDENEHTP